MKLLSDTDAETEKLIIEMWRAAPAWRKMQQVAALNAMLDSIVRADIVQRYPNADEAEIRRRWAKRKLPPDVYLEFFGDDNHDHQLR